MKRTDYINWNEFFMGIAKLAAKRSKDPSTQVGCCIARNNRVVSVGYNGMPNGISDDDESNFPWSATSGEDFLHSKYTYVVHAELNAILNAPDNSRLKGSTLYCTLAPCNECMKAIIQAGIKKVIFLDDKYLNREFTIAAIKMAKAAGVEFTLYETV